MFSMGTPESDMRANDGRPSPVTCGYAATAGPRLGNATKINCCQAKGRMTAAVRWRQAFAAPYTKLASGRGGLPHVRSPGPRRASARRYECCW